MLAMNNSTFSMRLASRIRHHLLQVHDEPAYVGWKPSSLGLLGLEQTLHTLRFEAPYPALEGALGDAGLLGAFIYGTAEEHVPWRIRSYSSCSGHQHNGSISCQSSVGSTR
jgi:hypothetical protein